MKDGVLSRRQVLGTGITTALGLSLAGCAGSPDEGGDGGGKTLRIAITLDPGAPLNLYTDTEDWMAPLVFEGLLHPSPFVEETIPGLATEVTQVDDDATVWEATIREGVNWHDGEPFTAEDVVFAFRRYRDGPSSRYAHHVAELPKIDVIEKVDDRTVRFECAFPTASLADVTFTDTLLIPKHVWEDKDEEPQKYTGLPVGTGPYELVEYTEGERYRFEANEDYYLGEPLVGELVFPIITDPSTTFTALKSGDIDTTLRPVPPTSFSQFEQDDDLKIVSGTRLSPVEIRVNYFREPLRNHEFRRALSRALDMDAIVDVVMLGRAISGTEGYPHPKSSWTAPDLKIPHEPEEARATFDELGFRDRDGDGVRESPDGEKISFTVKVNANEPQHIRAAELIKGQLAEFGIESEVQSRDLGTLEAEGVWGSRSFDLLVKRSDPHLNADPDQYVLNHRGQLMWATGEIPYPEYEALEEEYIQATTLEEQKEALFEMQRLHSRQPTIIPIWFPENHVAVRPEAYDKWAESPGFGVHHKWSFLPEDVRENAVTETF